jgi:methylphosphotriester-DNA--protein-cysteine methyltransferase
LSGLAALVPDFFGEEEYLFGKIEVHPIVLRFQELLETDEKLRKVPVSVIARRLGVSTSHLQHLVRRDLGATCKQLIRAKCVERLSQAMLDHPELTIGELADGNGCELQTMHRDFVAILGINPGEIRRRGTKICTKS